MSLKTRVRRVPERAVYDTDTIHAILDEGLIAHVGLVDDRRPYVIPMLYARVGDLLYLHGAASSRLVREAGSGVPVCATVTLLDGVVLARSAFHHSLNYRSVVVQGRARAVEPEAERLNALEAFMERLLPGRWDAVREPSPPELKATRVLALALDHTSAKVRTGPPVDRAEDYAHRTWAGVIPLRLTRAPAVPDPRLFEDIEEPEAVRRWRPGK
jgi:uncharacterized protein